ADAEQNFKAAWEGRCRTLGHSHPATARSVTELASVVAGDARRRKEAQAWYRKALEAKQACYGASHPEAASCMIALAYSMWQDGNRDEAEEFYKRALLSRQIGSWGDGLERSVQKPLGTKHMESHVHDALDTLEEPAETDPSLDQDHVDTPCSQGVSQRRLRLRVGVGLALAGLVLTCIGVAVWVLPIPDQPTLGASQCIDDSAREEPPLAWTGKKAGPLERQLGVITPAQAAWIVLQAGQTANDVATNTTALTKELAAEAAPRVSPKKVQKRNRARCILQTLAVGESIAKIATNIKAASAVCGPDRIFKYIPGKFGKALVKLRKIVCSVNIELVISGFLAVAGNLAEASISCSIAVNSSSSLNLNEQFDAGCASAAYQMTNALVSVSSAFSIAIPGCEIVAKGLEKTITGALKGLGQKGISDFGGGKLTNPSQVKAAVKALQNELTPADFLSETSTFGRRLFLGGGKGAIMTQCVVDVMQALTQLSLMGIGIDSLANAACDNPSVGRVTSRALPKFLRKRIENGQRATCGTGVATIIAQLGLATVFLSFTSFHCTNEANIRAICGAGIAGATGALSGIAGAGMAAYVACTEGQRLDETEALSNKFVADFLAEEATSIVQESCPDLSLQCFLEFTQFFSNCPAGASVAGPVTPSCPVPPSPQACPGIEPCVNEFEALRPSLTTWFPLPTAPLEFAALVNGAQSCFEYLTCFLTPGPSPSPRRLQSDALRSMLLQKVVGPLPERWRSLIHGEDPQEGPRESHDGVPAEGVPMINRLWNRSVGSSASQGLSRAVLQGGQFLGEAARELHKREANHDLCLVNDGPLMDDNPETSALLSLLMIDFDELDEVEPEKRPYDLVIYGATGYSGCLAVEHLDALLSLPSAASHRWAIAGRSEEKLQKMAARCQTRPKVIVANTRAEIEEMVEEAVVVLALAGPYLACGEQVLRACVEKGTHYIDITGEVNFSHFVIQKYHQAAKEKGIMIVQFAGAMSVPDDLAAYLLVRQLGPLKQLRVYTWGADRGSFAREDAARVDGSPGPPEEDSDGLSGSELELEAVEILVGPNASETARDALKFRFRDYAQRGQTTHATDKFQERCAQGPISSRECVALSDCMIMRGISGGQNTLSFGTALHLGRACTILCSVCSFNSSNRTCRKAWLCDFCHARSTQPRNKKKGSGAWQVSQLPSDRIAELYEELRQSYEATRRTQAGSIGEEAFRHPRTMQASPARTPPASSQHSAAVQAPSAERLQEGRLVRTRDTSDLANTTHGSRELRGPFVEAFQFLGSSSSSHQPQPVRDHEPLQS
ncbi:SCCPDH, partial [Symbiodinium necroappetens]